MPSITPLPSPPSRDRLDTFDQDADNFLDALPSFVDQANTLAASLGTLAAPGALAIPYTFSSSVTDADPGPGVVRLNNSAQSSSTAIRLDLVSSAGDYWGNVLTTFGAATGSDKGQLRIAKVGEPTKWAVFTVRASADATGYINLTVTPLGASGAAPFVNGDPVLVFFTRTGDKGELGTAPTAQQIRDALGVLDVPHGGTGGTTPLTARNALDVLSSGQVVRLSADNNAAGTRLQSGSPPSIAGISGAGQADNVALIVGNAGNPSASSVVQFLRGGSFAAFFGLDTDNQWKVGGYSMGPNAYRIWHEGNLNPANYAPLAGATFFGGITVPYLHSTSNANVDGTLSCGDLVATSDETLKYGWQDVDHDEFVRELASTEQAGRFWWKNTGDEETKRGDRMDLGIGAQSVQRYAPEVTRLGDDGVLRINQGALSTLGVVALARKVLDLEARLERLAEATGAL